MAHVCAAVLPCQRRALQISNAGHAACVRPCALQQNHTCGLSLQGQDSRRRIRRDVKAHGLLDAPFPSVSPDVLTQPFAAANVLISIPWALMIIAPRWELTKDVFRSRWSLIIPCLLFPPFFLAAAVIDSPNLADVLQKSVFLFTDASADPANMSKLMGSTSYTAQDWVHLLIWDYGFGRIIYLDALAKKVPMRHSLLLCFIGGPLGYLTHELTCAIVAKLRPGGLQGGAKELTPE